MKTNDLPAITPGSMWAHNDRSPWPPKPDAPIYFVAEVREGWVRYICRGSEERISERGFRENYIPLPAGHGSREFEDELRERFEKIASAHNWSVERTADGSYRFERTLEGWLGFLWGAGART